MSIIVYHGTEYPDQQWAAGLTGHIVVLQAYHPIVAAGEFGNWFPNVTRHIYTNPTAIDPSRRTVAEKYLYRDPTDRWKLARLKWPDASRIAIDDALKLSSLPGVEGVFVDDVDLLAQSDRTAVLSYFNAIGAGAGNSISLNRGFEILGALADSAAITAVLLEGLDRDASLPYGRDMLRTFAPILRRAAARGVEFHRLEYGSRPGRDRVPMSVRRIAQSEVRARDESLAYWDDWSFGSGFGGSSFSGSGFGGSRAGSLRNGGFLRAGAA